MIYQPPFFKDRDVRYFMGLGMSASALLAEQSLEGRFDTPFQNEICFVAGVCAFVGLLGRYISYEPRDSRMKINDIREFLD